MKAPSLLRLSMLIQARRNSLVRYANLRISSVRLSAEGATTDWQNATSPSSRYAGRSSRNSRLRALTTNFGGPAGFRPRVQSVYSTSRLSP